MPTRFGWESVSPGVRWRLQTILVVGLPSFVNWRWTSTSLRSTGRTWLPDRTPDPTDRFNFQRRCIGSTYRKPAVQRLRTRSRSSGLYRTRTCRPAIVLLARGGAREQLADQIKSVLFAASQTNIANRDGAAEVRLRLQQSRLAPSSSSSSSVRWLWIRFFSRHDGRKLSATADPLSSVDDNSSYQKLPTSDKRDSLLRCSTKPPLSVSS